MKYFKLIKLTIILFPILALSSIPMFRFIAFEVSAAEIRYDLYRQLVHDMPMYCIPFACIILIILRVTKLLKTVEFLVFAFYYVLVECIMLLYAASLV